MDKKRRQIQRRRQVKRLLVIWGIFGIIGLLWVVSSVFQWFAGLFAGENTHMPDEKGNVEDVWRREDVETLGEDERKDGTDAWISNSGYIFPEAEKIVTEAQCRELYEGNEKLLVLVNRDRALEEGAYESDLRNICNGRLQAADVLYDDLVDLLAAADEEGYQYWIASAYRSRERQQELVDEDVARYMAQGMNRQQALEKTYEQTMPAGKSEHETGLALDILCSENLNMDVTQAEEPGNKWLTEHAHEYGFILRYPEDREEITGILYEPWHFRYVGKEAAAFLWENDLTLEEFWEILER